jgi:hypothetical protein
VTYLSEVIADSPTHYWRMADPGGSLCHDIGSSPVHMHTVGSPTLGYSGPVSGGGSLDLSLDNTYANTGEPIAYAGGSVTLECFVWSWQDKANPVQWVMWPLAAGQICIYNDGAKWRGIYTATFIPAAGVDAPVNQSWTHLAFCYGAGAGQLYVNGTPSGAAVAVAAQAAQSAIFNCLFNALAANRGFISEVAIYATKLSGARVAAHYGAADQRTQAPVYQQAGKFDGTSGGSTPVADNTDLILQSVRKTYV